MRGTQVLTPGIVVSGGSRPLAAQTESQPQTPVSILAQVREATGGEAWERIDELRTEGTVLIGGKTGTIATFENLRTGANADRVDLEGVGRVENHADMPGQNWEQDEAGDVLLTPGGKEPGDIDDLYIHRDGWWEPSFGGATATLLPPATDEGVTYDLLRIKVPGGNGFTLWIDRSGQRLSPNAAKRPTPVALRHPRHERLQTRPEAGHRSDGVAQDDQRGGADQAGHCWGGVV